MSKRGSSFNPKGTGSFGDFGKIKEQINPKAVKPIQGEFSKGSVPGSIWTIDRESAWSRWRRGYEIYAAGQYFTYEFEYNIPDVVFDPSPPVVIEGAFIGFPTTNRELGMHWCLWRYAGTIRTDLYVDPITTSALSIESVTEDKNYWYVKLTGNWSPANPLPPPLYFPGGQKPLISGVYEDRIVTQGGDLIEIDTINPNTQTRYGYVSAVLLDINETTGVLKFRKSGSVQATPDEAFVTPSPIGFTPGRFLSSGARYSCTCQDFTRRDYFYVSSENPRKLFPRTNIATIKPGRFELTKRDGILKTAAQTDPSINLTLEINAPPNFDLTNQVTTDRVTNLNATRDSPGLYADFGGTYTRSVDNLGTQGSAAEGMSTFADYTSVTETVDSSSIPQKTITSLEDRWSPLLDELRYCKHIYALKFADRVFPPEPSDFPTDIPSMAEWEKDLVEKTDKDIDSIKNQRITRESLSRMDVPPYNCQSLAIYPMLQRLFNFATDRIDIANFTMIDQYGNRSQP
jgi:hypothetical protein